MRTQIHECTKNRSMLLLLSLCLASAVYVLMHRWFEHIYQLSLTSISSNAKFTAKRWVLVFKTNVSLNVFLNNEINTIIYFFSINNCAEHAVAEMYVYTFVLGFEKGLVYISGSEAMSGCRKHLKFKNNNIR